MSVYIFHENKLVGVYKEWQHTSTLKPLSYIYNDQWYIVNNFGGAMPISLPDVPPACLKILKMLTLVIPK